MSLTNSRCVLHGAGSTLAVWKHAGCLLLVTPCVVARESSPQLQPHGPVFQVHGLGQEVNANSCLCTLGHHTKRAGQDSSSSGAADWAAVFVCCSCLPTPP